METILLIGAIVHIVFQLIEIILFTVCMIRNPKSLRVNPKDLWCFFGTGIVSMVFFNYCYFRLISISSLSVAAVMLYTAPVFVMLLSAVLFRERITRRQGVAMALALVALVMLNI